MFSLFLRNVSRIPKVCVCQGNSNIKVTIITFCSDKYNCIIYMIIHAPFIWNSCIWNKPCHGS